MKETINQYHKIRTYTKYTARGDARYVAEIQHTALNVVRVITETEPWILETKVKNQLDKWDDIWSKNWHKSEAIREKEINLSLADQKTNDYKEKIEEIENLLKSSIKKDHRIKWKSLKSNSTFEKPNPKLNLKVETEKITKPKGPSYKSYPPEPVEYLFTPKLTLIDKMFKSSAQRKIDNAKASFNQSVSLWEIEVKKIEIENNNIEDRYNKAVENFENEKKSLANKFKALEAEWEVEMDDFYSEQKEYNDKIEILEKSYKNKDATAIIEYSEIVLRNTDYPESFLRDFDLEYSVENKFLIVDYALPAPEDFPHVIEVKYIAAKKETKDILISDTALAKMYDTTVYNISLKITYELFQADSAEAFDAIVFNGWVNTINKGTGKATNNCIVSLQVKKAELNDIDLANVDPKICFKNLKGIGSSKLIGITPIQPIIKVNKNDKRFINSHDVAHVLDDSYNLAAMGWEDFEHLIRELFEKEFSTNGGEVKVTQASRDGGVDAVAFDPDPIRGGKIVIQAKRYTNTVGVSAIRDLYGTVVNEGATKGILVTTSDYGPDAYEFAKNKPLTLLSGNNLLYLLEKHGHKAKIDLIEAKRLAKE